MKINNTKNKKVQLLAPAGDLFRGKIALDYGADAIYLGGQAYSLRARASNFDFNAIKEISQYAHKNNKKIYLVVNTVNQNSMLKGFLDYLKEIKKYKPDAFIVSDPFIINEIRKVDKKTQIHVSTQQSVCNSKAALFFARNNCQRIILSREVSFKELQLLIKNVKNKIAIETFIHGAVCVAYSGRCMLSSNFCLRDANIGGCAQSCRWEYKLFDDKKVYSDKFSMSAKDMCMVSKIKELIKSGVSSFKIEGRMKTEHYIATVVNAYRKVIDNIYSNKNSDIYVHDIKNAANRETDLAWFNGKPGINKMLYHEVLKQVKQNYAFLIKEKINDTTYKILTKNKIRLSDKYEILSPNLDEIPTIKIIKILDSENNSVDFISAPMSYCIITFNKKINLKENDIGRIN